MLYTRHGAELVPGAGAFSLPCRVGGGELNKQPNDALDNVVDLGKVMTVFAVVKYLDRIARQYGFGELEQRHVGSAPRNSLQRELQQTLVGDERHELIW